MKYITLLEPFYTLKIIDFYLTVISDKMLGTCFSFFKAYDNA